MFIKRTLFCLALSILTAGSSYAQQNDFCDAVTAIMKDGPNQFRNVRNPTPDKNQGSITYKSSINVPGTIISRFIASMGLFYEGALKQSKTLDGLKDDYEKYKVILNTCLAPKGYAMRQVDNFNVGMEYYKKILYMPDFKKGGDAPPPTGHASMEVDYNKSSGQYTLIMYIFAK